MTKFLQRKDPCLREGTNIGRRGDKARPARIVTKFPDDILEGGEQIAGERILLIARHCRKTGQRKR